MLYDENYKFSLENAVKQCLKCGKRYPKQETSCIYCNSKSFCMIDKNLPENLVIGVSMTAKAIEKNSEGKIVRKTIIKQKSMFKDHQTKSGFVNKSFRVDQKQNKGIKMISEKIYDPITGEILREYEHPLKEHPKNRGSAKFNSIKK